VTYFAVNEHQHEKVSLVNVANFISLPTIVIGALAHGDQLNQRRIYGT